MGHSSQESVRVSHDLFDMLMQIEKEAVLADLLARVTTDRTRREARERTAWALGSPPYTAASVTDCVIAKVSNAEEGSLEASRMTSQARCRGGGLRVDRLASR